MRRLAASIGHVKLGDLRPSHIDGYIAAESGVRSPRSTRHDRAVLRNALNRAIADRLLTFNAVKGTKPPQLADAERVVLTPDETRRLLAMTANDRLFALWQLAAATGMRSAELLGLAWRDVDLDEAVLSVRQTLQRVRGEFVLVPPKSKTSIRPVPLTSDVVAALRAHRLRQAQERLAHGAGWSDDALVFVTEAGLPLHASDVLRRFRRALAAADLPPVRLHDLRHGVGHFLMAQGVSPRVVMQMLGHSTVTLTLNTYSRASVDLIREAADAMQAAIGAAGLGAAR